MKNRLFFLLLIIFFTGCYDKIELENRSFAFSIGVDLVNDEFLVTYAIPNNTDKIIKETIAPTISGAIYKSTFYTPDILDLRHTKVIVVGRSILENREKFHQLIDILERNKQLSRKVILVAAKDANDFLKSETEENKLVSKNILGFYKNHGNLFGLNKDLDEVLQNVENKKIIIIPFVEIIKNENDKNELLIDKGLVLNDYKYIDIIEGQALKGYILVNGNGEHEYLYDSKKIAPLKVTKNTSQTKITESGNQLLVTITVKIEGDIQEFNDFGKVSTMLDKLTTEYERDIKKYLLDTKEYFHAKNLDGFDIKDRLYKFHFDLYEKYAVNNPAFYEDVKYDFVTKVKINSIGSVK